LAEYDDVFRGATLSSLASGPPTLNPSLGEVRPFEYTVLTYQRYEDLLIWLLTVQPSRKTLKTLQYDCIDKKSISLRAVARRILICQARQRKRSAAYYATNAFLLD